MIWFAVVLLAGAGFVIAAKVLKLPRPAYALLGAGLALGLAGYAWQGSAHLPGAPTAARAAEREGYEVLVAARRAMFGGDVPPARYIAVADGFMRQGQTDDAAGFLQVAVQEEPGNAEAWVALGNALVAHAEGNLTPAASQAYNRAAALAPANPAAFYFEGLALIGTGRAPDARDRWAQALERVPADAPYRPIIAGQLARLEQLMQAADAQRAGGASATP